MPVNVTVYPHKLSGEGAERLEIEPCTLLEFARDNDPDFDRRPVPLFSLRVNGRPVPYEHWRTAQVYHGQLLEVQIEPRGPAGVIVGYVLSAVAFAAAVYAYQQATNIPDNQQRSVAQGSSIYRADLQANRPKKNGVVPERFGEMPCFPEIITQVRRKYISHEEWLYVGLCLGVGEFDIAAADIRIGETPVSNYSSDISYDIVDPGGSVAAIEAAQNWYTTREIGATAGTSGLQLVSTTASFDDTVRYSFSGTELTLTDTSSPAGPVSWPLAAGEHITISGTSNNGRYRVVSVNSPDNEATLQKLILIPAGGYEGGGGYWQDDTSWTTFITESNVTATTSYNGTATTNQWSNWINVLPEGETTQTIEVDLRFPRGLGEYNDDGDVINHTVEIAYEYREAGGSGATYGTISKTDATADERGYTETIDLGSPAIEPQIRFRRNTTEIGTTAMLEDVEVVRVKGQLTAASSYADVTTAWFAVKGTNAIASAAENLINIDAQRLLPTTAAYKALKDSGTATTNTAHSQVGAPIIYLMLQAGYELDDIDVDAINTLQTTWTSRSDTFNAEFTEASTLFDMLKRIAAVGYAEPTIEDGLLTLKRDGVRSTYDYLYTPDKFLDPGLSRVGQFYDPDEPDGVEVEYFDRSTRQNQVVTYTLAAAGDPASPTKPKKIRAFGITDETRAWRFGSIERRRMHYKPIQIAFTTELDGLNSGYLDAPAVADELLVNGATGFVTAVDGDTLTLDTNVTFVTGETHKLALSKKDGTMSGLYTATAGSAANVVDISPSLDFVPDLDGSHELPVFAFGTTSDWAQQVIVRDVVPQGGDRVRLTCEEYIADIWDDIDNAPA